MLRSVQPTPVLLVIACFTVYLVMFHSTKPTVVINVHSDPSFSEMSRIIQQQREKITFLTLHNKVIYRCPDDEAKIKYPRQASDNLTETIMETNDECGITSNIDAVVIVHTAATHFDRRERFRRTYSDYNNTKPYRLKVVFLIATAVDASLMILLEIENREFGDTVVGGFLDTYQNLTLKAVMGFRWLTNTCPGVKLIIKMDDDVFLDVRKFFSTYWNKIPKSLTVNTIHCLVWYNALVGRTGKWKVEKNLFANSSYQFPYCAGLFTVVTPDLIANIYKYGKSIDFFWIDDVFLYGMVPAVIKGVNFVQLGIRKKFLTQNYREYKKCTEDRHRCTFFATLTDNEKQFEEEYAILFPPELPPPKNMVISVDQNKTAKQLPPEQKIQAAAKEVSKPVLSSKSFVAKETNAKLKRK